MSEQYDVIVVGAGIVGLTAALAFAQKNYRVALLDKASPELPASSTPSARVCAINPGTYQYLSGLISCDDLGATAVKGMQVWDAASGGELDFEASDLGQPATAFIVDNATLIHTLHKAVSGLSTIEPYFDIELTSLSQTDTLATVSLRDERALQAPLLVGADGARSWVRKAAGFSWRERPYGHDALIAVLEADEPHAQFAYQAFMAAGPLGILPLQAPNQIAIVWSSDAAQADELMALSSIDFADRVAEGLEYRLGCMTLVGERFRIPLTMRHVSAYLRNCCVLVGDAAHTVHPLAGQGVNLGLMDVAELVKQVVRSNLPDEGACAHRYLRQFERTRKLAAKQMLCCMDLLKDLFSFTRPSIVNFRGVALQQINRSRLLKKWFSGIVGT